MAAAISIYTDEHISNAKIKGLRNRSINVMTCFEASLLAAKNIQHLQFAKQKGLVILTKDADLLRLHTSGTKHSGIIYARSNYSIGRIIQKVFLIYHVLSSEEMINHIEFI